MGADAQGQPRSKELEAVIKDELKRCAEEQTRIAGDIRRNPEEWQHCLGAQDWIKEEVVLRLFKSTLQHKGSIYL